MVQFDFTSAHVNEDGQRKAMAENGWNIDDFHREFYKNYL